MHSFNPIAQDPVKQGSIFAEDKFLQVRCENDSLFGIVRMADGAGPHPTVVFLHGFPGTEKNEDIAHALVRAGYNTVTFSHRGAWGSNGEYRFSNLVPDTQAILHTLRDQAEDLRIDINRLGLIGYSMGGFTALHTAMADLELKAIVSISGFNISRFVQDVLSEDFLIDFCKSAWDAETVSLNGVTGSILVDEVLENAELWDFTHRASKLGERPVLLVHGTDDHVVQPMIHHYPTAKILKEAGVELTEAELPAGHSYLGQRIALAETVLAWLNENLQ